MMTNGSQDSSGRTLVAACRRDIVAFTIAVAMLVSLSVGAIVQSAVNTATIKLEQKYQGQEIKDLKRQVEKLGDRHLK